MSLTTVTDHYHNSSLRQLSDHSLTTISDHCPLRLSGHEGSPGRNEGVGVGLQCVHRQPQEVRRDHQQTAAEEGGHLHHLHAQGMSPPCSRYVTSMLKVCHLHVQGMSPPCSKYVTSMLKICHLHAQSMSPPCSKYVTSMLKVCHLHAKKYVTSMLKVHNLHCRMLTEKPMFSFIFNLLAALICSPVSVSCL